MSDHYFSIFFIGISTIFPMFCCWSLATSGNLREDQLDLVVAQGAALHEDPEKLEENPLVKDGE